MSELKAIINAYNRLSFSDRIIFYSTISNDIPVNDGNLQSFLTEVRLKTETGVCTVKVHMWLKTEFVKTVSRDISAEIVVVHLSQAHSLSLHGQESIFQSGCIMYNACLSIKL